MKRKLTVGFSPCPNDTFIFDALVNGRLDTNGLSFEVILADVEELNIMASEGKLDVTKISYNAYAYVNESYQLLNAGSALGNNCGPLLIAKKSLLKEDLVNADIAIPGVRTTANFLMSYAYPNLTNKREMLFSDIEKAVLNDEVDAGVIIHENRFTYEDKGLVKIADLGEVWENSTNFPIPLGGIAIHRRIDKDLRLQFDKLLTQSVQFAFNNPAASKDYVKCYAQEMDEAVTQSHINLYVNEYSLNLGEKGKAAISKMYEVGQQFGMPPISTPLFVED